MAVLFTALFVLAALVAFLAPLGLAALLALAVLLAAESAEHPWRGWGLDAARTFGDRIPLHPHNWPLQLWLELGLPGALIVTALWLGLLRRASALQDPFQRAAAAAGISAYLAIGAVSFGLWQAWWLAAGVLAALGAIVAARSAAQT